MAFRIKHVLTELYYQPHKHRGSNLSKTGKLYHTEANAKRALGTSNKITIQVAQDSIVHKLTKDLLDYKVCTYAYKQLITHTDKKDWLIEEC